MKHSDYHQPKIAKPFTSGPDIRRNRQRKFYFKISRRDICLLLQLPYKKITNKCLSRQIKMRNLESIYNFIVKNKDINNKLTIEEENEIFKKYKNGEIRHSRFTYEDIGNIIGESAEKTKKLFRKEKKSPQILSELVTFLDKYIIKICPCCGQKIQKST